MQFFNRCVRWCFILASSKSRVSKVPRIGWQWSSTLSNIHWDFGLYLPSVKTRALNGHTSELINAFLGELFLSYKEPYDNKFCVYFMRCFV